MLRTRGHCRWNVERVAAKFTKPVPRTRRHHKPESLALQLIAPLFVHLLCSKQKPVLFYFLALSALIQPRLHSLNQGYTTHIDIRPYGHRSDSTSLSTTMPVVPLSCAPANTLCCCEWWWWWWGGAAGFMRAGLCVCVQGKYRKWEIVREPSLSDALLLPAAHCQLQMRVSRHPGRLSRVGVFPPPGPLFAQ